MMDFWHGKRVLVTGHTGFKGSWLTVWLRTLGAEVIGYSLPPPSQPNLFEVANVSDGIVSIIGDVRDLSHLKKEMRSHEPHIVIHMAAQALVRSSYDDPVETFSTNMMGTVNLLEAARHTGSVRAVVSVTSDKCYENREMLWGYRENDPMGGYDPYSASKGCAELIVSAYKRSFFAKSGIALASVRAGNVIGGGDWSEDRLIPDIVGGLVTDQPIAIRNPNATRPWQHVTEPLAGYLMLAERLWEQGNDFAEGWNFGPNEDGAKSVAWIVDYLRSKWGGAKQNWFVDAGDHPHEAGYLKLDCAKAKARLGWQPKLDLAIALDWVLEWYQAFHAGDVDMRVLTEQQIARYQKWDDYD